MPIQHRDVRPTSSQRLPLDIERVMRTRYKIDSFQQLFDITTPDFTPLYAQLKTLPELAANTILAEEAVIQR